MLTIAASKGWEVQCADITRAFLQTEDLDREVYVIPPPEAQIPNNKVWKLKRAVYGLIDASRGFFLNHSDKHKKFGFEALRMDPATFVMKRKGEPKAISASHVDDTNTIASKEDVKKIGEFVGKQFKCRACC